MKTVVERAVIQQGGLRMRTPGQAQGSRNGQATRFSAGIDHFMRFDYQSKRMKCKAPFTG
jgi:hypothetical protein